MAIDAATVLKLEGTTCWCGFIFLFSFPFSFSSPFHSLPCPQPLFLSNQARGWFRRMRERAISCPLGTSSAMLLMVLGAQEDTVVECISCLLLISVESKWQKLEGISQMLLVPHFPELESTGPFCAVVAESRKYWRIRNHRLGWWKVRDDMALPTRGQHPQKIFVKILHFGAF